MHSVTSVEGEWLAELGPMFYVLKERKGLKERCPIGVAGQLSGPSSGTGAAGASVALRSERRAAAEVAAAAAAAAASKVGRSPASGGSQRITQSQRDQDANAPSWSGHSTRANAILTPGRLQSPRPTGPSISPSPATFTGQRDPPDAAPSRSVRTFTPILRPLPPPAP